MTVQSSMRRRVVKFALSFCSAALKLSILSGLLVAGLGLPFLFAGDGPQPAVSGATIRTLPGPLRNAAASKTQKRALSAAGDVMPALPTILWGLLSAQSPGAIPIPNGPAALQTAAQAATASSFRTANFTPLALAIGPDGVVYVATAENKILQLDPATGLWRPFAGSDTPSSSSSSAFSLGAKGATGDGGPATAVELELAAASPLVRSGIAADSRGNIFIADTRHGELRRVDAATGVIARLLSKGAPVMHSSVRLAQPLALAFDRGNNLYIADGGANAVFELPASRGEPCEVSSECNELEMIAHAVLPGAMAVDAAGNNLFLALPFRGQVVRMDLHRRDARVVVGQKPNGLRNSIAGLALDGAGNLFIAVSSANRIYRADAKTGAITSVAGTGTAAFSGDGGPAALAGINQPGDMSFDAHGNLYFVDQGNKRVRVIAHAGAEQQQSGSLLTFNPPSLAFPPEPNGGVSAPMTTMLTNTSSGPVTISSIGFTGNNPGDFTNTTSCGITLAAGQSCGINVTFKPTQIGSRSAILTVTDNFPSSPEMAPVSGTSDDYQLAVASNGSMTATVVAGKTATYSLMVVPDMTFSGTVSLTCSPALPIETACMPNPASLNVMPGTNVPFTVTITTTNPSAAPPRGPLQFPALPPIALALAAFVALAAYTWRAKYALASGSPLGIRLRPRIVILRRRLAPALAMFALLAIVPIMASCKPGHRPVGGTPPGTYNINVMGNSQGASRSITLTLVVE